MSSSPVVVFLVVAFGFSWLVGLAPAVLSSPGSEGRFAIRYVASAIFMLGPLVGTLAAQRASGQRGLAQLDVKTSPNRFWLICWLGPLALALVTLVVALLFPDVRFDGSLAGALARMPIPAEDLEDALAEIQSVPRALLYPGMVLQALVAGATINALFAFGEEIGWRGFLHRAWRHLGMWRASTLIGAIWGVWHAPLILQGHNYPDHPVLGVGVMVVMCILLSPLAFWLRERTGSPVAIAVAHGTFNACAGIAVALLAGGSDLTIGFPGAAGLLTLAAANLVLFVATRRQPRVVVDKSAVRTEVD